MLHEHQGFTDALLASIAALPPRRIAEAALASARRCAEAVIEIDSIGTEQRCPAAAVKNTFRGVFSIGTLRCRSLLASVGMNTHSESPGVDCPTVACSNPRRR